MLRVYYEPKRLLLGLWSPLKRTKQIKMWCKRKEIEQNTRGLNSREDGWDFNFILGSSILYRTRRESAIWAKEESDGGVNWPVNWTRALWTVGRGQKERRSMRVLSVGSSARWWGLHFMGVIDHCKLHLWQWVEQATWEECEFRKGITCLSL